MLYMKGTPAQPQCGFSKQVVSILHSQGDKRRRNRQPLWRYCHNVFSRSSPSACFYICDHHLCFPLSNTHHYHQHHHHHNLLVFWHKRFATGVVCVQESKEPFGRWCDSNIKKKSRCVSVLYPGKGDQLLPPPPPQSFRRPSVQSSMGHLVALMTIFCTFCLSDCFVIVAAAAAAVMVPYSYLWQELASAA